MDSQKYLIIVTLVEGQNFTVPDGAPDRLDATVFAEARFGNESILRSDPIKLINSNPEFVTELAWQLDKKSLHQLRVERKSIKLQVFMQICEKRKTRLSEGKSPTNENLKTDDTSANRVELIGYTVIDIRSAQERNLPKLQWLPLLNPKFRKSSYNRPEIQIALTLSRIDEREPDEDENQPNGVDRRPNGTNDGDCIDSSQPGCDHELNDSDLHYKTCLDVIDNYDQINDEIIDHDIQIHTRDGCFYIYDARDAEKFTIDDCIEAYLLTISIPFTSHLDSLAESPKRSHYFSVDMFGSTLETACFDDLTRIGNSVIETNVFTTDATTLATYFDLNPCIIIRLVEKDSNICLGLATVQLNQLCSIDARQRSIEGIFMIQPTPDREFHSNRQPSIGVSVILKRRNEENLTVENYESIIDDFHDEALKEVFSHDLENFLSGDCDNATHQLTMDHSNQTESVPTKRVDEMQGKQIDRQGLGRDDLDHHFCFTIDLKEFNYRPDQRLIPTLRELVVRYSYPFFGYKDTITTDASVPISPTKSMIVSGFCEFNFATTYESLETALSEIPLHLDILACDNLKRVNVDSKLDESPVATCELNLADILNIESASVGELESSIATTISAPIYSLDNVENGQIQVYLSLSDRGRPSYGLDEPQVNNGVVDEPQSIDVLNKSATITKSTKLVDRRRFDQFIEETRATIESWKERCFQKLNEEMKARELERFRRIQQRFEARDSKREQDHREKMKELTMLENRFSSAIAKVESIERMLSNSHDQLKTKDALLDSRLDSIDLKISKAIDDVKIEYDKKLNNYNHSAINADNNRVIHDTHLRASKTASSIIPSQRTRSGDLNQPRRSSLRNQTNHITGGIPVPVRSSSLVKGVVDGSLTRFVRKPPGFMTTVVNGVNPKVRSNSASNRLNLSKETQEKLASLRREKAELLKRGCRPNDELIREINSLIEKLAC